MEVFRTILKTIFIRWRCDDSYYHQLYVYRNIFKRKIRQMELNFQKVRILLKILYRNNNQLKDIYRNNHISIAFLIPRNRHQYPLFRSISHNNN